MPGEKTLTKAQTGILDLIKAGYSVTAEPLGLDGEYRAVCEHYPHPKISTLKALERKGLVTFTLDEFGNKIYALEPTR